jgi:hypothetical protein
MASSIFLRLFISTFFVSLLKVLGQSGSADIKPPSFERVKTFSLLLFLSQLQSSYFAMRLIALLSVALAVSASALPRIASERDLGNNARGAGGRREPGADGDTNSDPQTSLSKCNESSMTSQRLYRPSSVGSRRHFHQL